MQGMSGGKDNWRITMLTTSFPLHDDHHSGTFIHELAQGLVDRGHEIRVVAPHAPGAVRREQMEGVDVWRFRYALRESGEVLAYDGGIPATLRTCRRAHWLLPQFVSAYLGAALLASRDSDLVHAHWTPSGLIGALVQAALRVPMVITTHGSDINELPDKGPKLYAARWILQRAHQVICVSEAISQSVKRIGVASNRVTVIHNGIDLSIFRNHSGERHKGSCLMYVGRLSSEKGVSTLIEAMPIICEKAPSANLTLVGDGPERRSLERQTRKLGVAGHVDFLGARPHKEIPRLMGDADVFVLPSLKEGFGVVLLEAMACGLPVVASETGGIPEIVDDGQTGLLVEPGNPEDLACTTCRLLLNKSFAARVAERGQADVRKRFSIETQLQQYEEIYADVVNPERED